MSTLAVVVLSGGLDSATALGLACESTADQVYAITFDYGQKHGVEIHAAQDLCNHYGVTQSIIPLPEAIFKGGVLTTEEEIPDMRYEDLPSGKMSPTYVPFRNGNLLSMAVAHADSLLRKKEWDGTVGMHSATVWAGMHAEDGAGFAYADCTPEFLGAMASAIYVGTYHRVRLWTPFQAMEKWEIIHRGLEISVPYELTHSCYRGTRPACGHCSTCHARIDAFARAGVQDPIPYEASV